MKRRREYTIYTIDARAMLKLCERKDWCFDLTSEYDRSLIVESVKTYAESALFFQIRKAVREIGESNTPDAVTSKLVYLHFENGVVDENGNEDIKDEVTELLDRGFYLRFKGDKAFRRFVPFDKSASMSRQNVMSFISEDIFNKVDASLRLGLIWNLINVEPNKYYTYRGLYLTDGIEIPPSLMELNEKTVIVIDIDTMPVYDKIMIPKYAHPDDPAPFDPNEDLVIRREMMKPADRFTSLPYDGEGLICPEYARLINKSAIEDKQTEATSFQIRMPFSKGMLHTVDFHKFLKDQFPDEDVEKLEITDFFGKKRKIADAKIILTKSMFKCAKWFKDYYAKKDGKDEYYVDPMADYFYAFHKFNHAMYLVSSDANFRSDDYVKMNYQFLNTLDMDSGSFRKLIEKHIDDTKLITEDPYVGRSAILRTDDSEDEKINEDGDNELVKMDSWEYALKKNVAFINDPKIRKMIKQVQDGQIRDVRRGRIVVPGTIKYLSGDLLYLLTIIAEKCGVKDENNRIQYLRNYRVLYPDRFYMAGRQNFKLDDKKFYGILRSPHLSKNEQCALRPVKLQIYNKYFSQLKGVIMVSDKSSVPAALGGADFDGDTVKIIRDDNINSAIFNSVYEKAKVVFETEEGPVERIVNQRKLPVVDIVPPDAPERQIGERITYEDIRRAFSSNVGRISNTALTIGKLEYGEKVVPEGSTALCTLATGLEIDSVKTGMKPDTSELEALAADASDCFLSIKRTFDKVAANKDERNKVVHSELDERTGEYKTFFRYRSKNKKSKKLYSIGADQKHNIDLLPYYYAKYLAEKRSLKEKVKSVVNYQIPEYRFKFEEDKCWADKAMLDPRLPALMKIIGAYRKIIIDAWSFSRTRERTRSDSQRGSIITLLNTEYDRDMDKLFRSGASLDDGLETAYEVLYDALPLSVNVEAALARMKESGWQYIKSFEDKEAALKEIIGAEEIPLKALEILCDTYDNGYQFLNYILQDTGLFRTSEESDAEELEETVPELQDIPKGKWKKDFDPDIYRRLHSDYRRTPENRNIWMRKAAGTCRNEVYDLFDGDIEAAIKCTLLLDGTNDVYSGDVYDENHSFLWDVFTAEDISKVVFAEEGGKDA